MVGHVDQQICYDSVDVLVLGHVVVAVEKTVEDHEVVDRSEKIVSLGDVIDVDHMIGYGDVVVDHDEVAKESYVVGDSQTNVVTYHDNNLQVSLWQVLVLVPGLEIVGYHVYKRDIELQCWE